RRRISVSSGQLCALPVRLTFTCTPASFIGAPEGAADRMAANSFNNTPPPPTIFLNRQFALTATLLCGNCVTSGADLSLFVMQRDARFPSMDVRARCLGVHRFIHRALCVAAGLIVGTACGTTDTQIGFYVVANGEPCNQPGQVAPVD